jgi:pimeloyl-ACP methyl ester carboxylesterase
MMSVMTVVMRFHARALLRCVGPGLLALGCAAGAPTRALDLRDCQVPGLDGTVRCGVLTVPENADDPRGPTIGLHVVVLPARAAPARGAIAFLAGGPGQAATDFAAPLARQWAALRGDRDVVLVDQRGTGRSNALACDVYRPADGVQGSLGGLLPPERIRECLASLGGRADLRRYGSPHAVADLERLRAALGHDAWDLHGTSYGSRLALLYMRAHPRRVRSAVLTSVVPPSVPYTLQAARNTERALDGALADCEAEPACRAAFPRVRAQLARVAARLDDGPAAVTVVDPRTGAPAAASLSRGAFSEAVRAMLYSPGATRRLPWLVDRADRGDLAPIAQFLADYRRAVSGGLSMGMHLAVTCAEDPVPASDTTVARETAGTLLGAYRVEQYRFACRDWPRGALPADFAEPVRSAVPTLLVSKELDPATPPAFGAEAARHLARGVHVVVPDGGHGIDGMEGAECVTRLTIAFIRRGSADGLDTSCVAGMRRFPFVTGGAP